MTRQEAMEKGFVYEGRVGIVPVYLTDLYAFGHKNPGLAAKSPWMEYVLDMQEVLNGWACAAINYFKPGAAVGLAIMFGPRLDGKPVTDEELD